MDILSGVIVILIIIVSLIAIYKIICEINNKFKEGLGGADIAILTVIVFLLVFTSIFALFNPLNFEQSRLASTVGIAAFVIPIILAFSRRFNLSARFGTGEVRKAIVIALTIIYIIMLSSYFYDVTLPMGKNLSKSLSNSSPLPIVILPVSSQLQNNSPGSVIAQLQNVSPTIPGEALKDITTNFFWIYAVIIVFYFGSRAWESVAETNMVKELKEVSPLELAQRRYILGMISSENYDEMSKKLGEDVVLVDVVPEENVNLKEATKFNLIVKNLGSEPRTVEKYSVNDDTHELKPAIKVIAKSYQNIIAQIPPSKIANEYEFKITADKGTVSTFKISIPKN